MPKYAHELLKHTVSQKELFKDVRELHPSWHSFVDMKKAVLFNEFDEFLNQLSEREVHNLVQKHNSPELALRVLRYRLIRHPVIGKILAEFGKLDYTLVKNAMDLMAKVIQDKYGL